MASNEEMKLGSRHWQSELSSSIHPAFPRRMRTHLTTRPILYSLLVLIFAAFICRFVLPEQLQSGLSNHDFDIMATASQKLFVGEPNEVTVTRKVTENITTFSVPFSRFGRIKFGGRQTVGKSRNDQRHVHASGKPVDLDGRKPMQHSIASGRAPV